MKPEKIYSDDSCLVLKCDQNKYLVLDDVYIAGTPAEYKGEGKKRKIIKPSVPAQNGEHWFTSEPKALNYAHHKSSNK